MSDNSGYTQRDERDSTQRDSAQQDSAQQNKADLDETEAYEEQGSRLPDWITDSPYWAVSAVLHLVVLLAIGTVVLLQTEEKQAESRELVMRRVTEPEPYDPTRRRELIERPEILMELSKDPVIVTQPEPIIVDRPKGPELNNLTDRNLDSDSIDTVFGPSGRASGMTGFRDGKVGLRVEGGGDDTESAVLAALHWLRRHQHPDGHWSCKDFVESCDPENGTCRNSDDGQRDGHSDGRGWDEFDVGVTALAILAYTGYGHTHRDGQTKEFRSVVDRAQKWLRKQQVTSDPDPRNIGRFGPGPGDGDDREQWIYNHAIATMAMAELLVMSRDRFNLAKSVEQATELCLRWQSPEFGWRYKFHEGSDTSVTGWMVLALKTSKACSQQRLLRITADRYKQHFEWALNWFRLSTNSRGVTGYLACGDTGSALRGVYPEPYPYTKDLSCMTAVSVLCRLFAGVHRRDDSIRDGVKVLMRETPQWRRASGKRKSKINMYYWYYATYALFQYGGKDWQQWNQEMKPALLESQRQGGDEDGSWDPVGEWGAPGGRVYATAIGAMTLEVYYRFMRVSGNEL